MAVYLLKIKNWGIFRLLNPILINTLLRGKYVFDSG